MGALLALAGRLLFVSPAWPAVVNVSAHARSQGSRVVVDPMGYILTVPQAEDDVLERPRTP